EKIIARQIQKSHLISQALNDNPAKKCIITPFIDSSMYSGPWRLNVEIPHLLSIKLKSAIKELTVDFLDSIPRNPVQDAQKKESQFVITGTIINFEIIDHAEINSQADRYKEQRISKVKIKLTLHETKTGKILVQNTFSGEVSQKMRNDNDWKSLENVPFDPQNTQFSGSLPALALEQLLEDAVEDLSTEIRM
ncbi:MAG: hypothetical protein GX640_07355, partial [Fibrobacter sp.]|nr:hypothetical protein [Fibrobacter sp.]